MDDDKTPNQPESAKQPEFPLADEIKGKPVDDDNGFVDDPLADGEAAVAEQIANMLDRDKEVRERVFRELDSLSQDRLRSIEMEKWEEKKNASHLAFWSEWIDLTSEEEKEKALQAIKAEINGLFGEIRHPVRQAKDCSVKFAQKVPNLPQARSFAATGAGPKREKALIFRPLVSRSPSDREQ
jgi:hypothetical protein